MVKSQKIISLLLSVIMIMSVFSIVPFTTSATEAGPAKTGATVDEAYPDFEYELLDDGTAEITNYCGEGGDVTIPSTISGYTVTRIGVYAFNGCTWLKSIDIPDSVTEISFAAFEGCTGLTSISVPDSVTSIGWYAFSGCTGLTSISIPDSVTNIGGGAFDNTAWYNNQPDGLVYIGRIAYKMKGSCPSEVVIKDGTLGIAGSAFSECTGLTSVTIPDSVKNIGEYAFSRCEGLTSVTIPESVTIISDSAFYRCTGLTDVTIPESVTIIDYQAFSGCTGLKSIDIPESVMSIGDFAFIDCTSLTSVTIPDSVTSIGRHAFDDCTGLTSIDIPDSVTNIGVAAFRNCTGLTNATIGNSVTSIGQEAFGHCTSLTSIIIPDSVTRIGPAAFSECTGLTSVTIPNTVTSVAINAFGYNFNEDKWSFIKVDDFIIYGYEGSEAEKYAKDNEFTFVPLKSKEDVTTGIVIDLPEDIDLTVKDITAEIISAIPDEGSKMTAYDISLTKGGKTVQPDNIVTVKIPCTNENAKAYRLESDGKMTDMKSKYKDGYIVFTTDHFSIYMLSEPKPAGVNVSGVITSYVDDSDVTIKLTGTDNNFTAEVKVKADYSIEAVPAGEYTLTVSKANHVTREYTVTVADTNVTQDVKLCPKGDVNGDGETDIMDCSLAQRYIRELTDLDPYQIACGDVSGEGDGELDIQDVSRILRHIRELAMLY